MEAGPSCPPPCPAPGSSDSPSSSNGDSLLSQDRLAQLIETPLELTSKSEIDVFKVPATKAATLFPGTKYVRIVLLSEEGNETHIFELSDDDELSKAVGTIKASKCAHATVFKENQLFVTPDYEQSQEPFADWRMLHDVYGVRSLASVPMCIGKVVYGVMTIACKQVGSLSARDEDVLHMLTSLVAPFAAMKQKQQQLEVTRMVLQMMMPARVVAMISELLGWNNSNVGNDSSWWL